MPIYAYRCERCGAEIEVMQPMTDPPLRRCPSCRSLKLKRVFQPVGIVLKGPGFYKTDSAPKRPSEDGKNKKKEEKPAAKTEPKGSEAGKAGSSD